MKKILWLSMIALLFVGCDKDKGDETENQLPACSISEPKAGEWKITSDLVVKGEAADEDGKIAELTLFVGGKKAEDLNVELNKSTASFTYTIKSDDLVKGKMTIRLEVKDDRGGKVSDEVEVNITENLSPTCKITEPEDRDIIVKEGGLVIKGEGEDKDGQITKVTLKLNGETVQGVTAVPFTHTVTPDNLAVGDLTITLEVEDDAGLTGSDEIKVTVSGNRAPLCSITSPADNSRIDMETGFAIKGEGEDEDGEIVSVVLKIDNDVMTEVTTLPFEYNVAAGALAEGEHKITLTVEDNLGAVGTDEVTVTMVVPNPDSMTDPRDGNAYKIVQIGDQIWMAENLAYLPAVYPSTMGSDIEGEAGKPFYYVHSYEGSDIAAAKQSEHYKTFGVLYNWHAATGLTKETAGSDDAVPSGVQGICPDGWHLPSRAEWNILTDYVYDNIEPTECYDYDWEFEKYFYDAWNISGALKSVDLWEPYSDAQTPGLGAGSDQFGFCAKPAGSRLKDTFYALYTQANFWSTAYQLEPYEGCRYITPSRVSYDVSAGATSSERGMSVRCLKN